MAVSAFQQQMPQFRYFAKSFNQMAKSQYGTQWQGVDNYVAQISAPLAKALATSNIGGYADGTNLLLQNLDSIMTSVLFDKRHLVKQRFIERVPSINPIYQWNRRNQYGTSRGTLGFAEGGIGPVGLGSWERDMAPVKFFGVQRGTTVISNLAGALGGMFTDPQQEEEYDGTMQLLGGVERSLVWGNSTIVDADGNDIFYDGSYRQLKARQPKNIIDMHGKPMDFDTVTKIAAAYADNKVVTADDIAAFMTPSTLGTLQMMKSQSERNTDMQSRDGGFTSGTPIEGYRTQIGFIPFIQDVFTEPIDGGKSPLAQADKGAPGAVTNATATVGAPSVILGQTSNWQASDAGTVYYTVGAFNANGESVGFTAPVGYNATAGDVITLTITNVAGALGYRIYRGTQTNGSDAQWIGEVAANGTASVAFLDDNSIMPGTDVAMFYNKDPRALVIAQMAPLLKLPLAIQNTTIPFGLLLLHTLAMKAPEWQFMVVNIGKTGYNS